MDRLHCDQSMEYWENPMGFCQLLIYYRHSNYDGNISRDGHGFGQSTGGLNGVGYYSIFIVSL